MLVVDASALIELLMQTPLGRRIGDRALAADQTLHAPHVVDLEVIQVMRRFVRHGAVSPQRAANALDDLLDLPIERHGHTGLIFDIWHTRDAMSAYDAAYVALAVALPAPVLTCDAKLAATRGHGAEILLMA